MPLDPTLCERLAPGELSLFRYTSWQRRCGFAPILAGATAADMFGGLQAVGEGHAAAAAPGRWVWIATTAGTVPGAAPDCIRADLSAAVIGFRLARALLDALLRRHSPARLDADLLAPGYRRIGFSNWTIELAMLPNHPPLVMVPRGHAANFEALAALGLAAGIETETTSP
jgi:hypothetical protein